MREKTLAIVKDRREAKINGNKSRIRILNSVFQGLSCSDSSQHKEIKEKNEK